jgi:hypothetical protein
MDREVKHMVINVFRRSLVIGLTALLLGASFIPLMGGVINNINEPASDDRVVNLARSNWWDTNWSYSKKIRINHDLVTDNLQNFPVLFHDISSDYAIHAQEDGDDFVFVSADNTTKYNHEIEHYDYLSGELVAWVNITFLSSSFDTILYIYYGNPLCGNQEDIFDTWNSGFYCVTHLGETGMGDRQDSTDNGNDGSPVGYEGNEGVEGMVNGADYLDGTDFIRYGDLGPVYGVSVWMKPDMTITKTSSGICFVDHSLGNHRVLLGASTDLLTDETICVQQNIGGDRRTGVIDKTITSSVFHMISYFWNNSAGRYDIYFDGEKQNVVSGNGHVPLMSGIDTLLGNISGSVSSNFTGIVDEFRYYSEPKTADWVQTDFNSINSQSTFITIYDEFTIIPQVYVDSMSGGFGVKAVIKNNGTIPANDLNWHINMSGGWIPRSREVNGTVDMPANSTKEVSNKRLFGIGSNVMITVTVGSDIKYANATWVLGPLVLPRDLTMT